MARPLQQQLSQQQQHEQHSSSISSISSSSSARRSDDDEDEEEEEEEEVVVVDDGGEGRGAVAAYMQDHLNDVFSNAGAVACVLLASNGAAWSNSVGESGGAGLWWAADPAGAAIIAIWIMVSHLNE